MEAHQLSARGVEPSKAAPFAANLIVRSPQVADHLEVLRRERSFYVERLAGYPIDFARAGIRELAFHDDEPPRESVGPLRVPIGLYYRLSGVSPFIEVVARKR